MIRILVFPNITYGGKGKNLVQDSYIEFMSKFIQSMNNHRNDLFYYMVLPRYEGKQRKLLELWMNNVG